MNNTINSTELIKHFWLYVLLLEDEKYYVGTTSKKDPYDRINEHMNGFYTAQWVKEHPMIKKIEIIDLGRIPRMTAIKLETQRTVQYMNKYGIQSTRGGTLNYHGKYIKFGNKYFTENNFYGIVGLSIMTLSMILLATMAWH